MAQLIDQKVVLDVPVVDRHGDDDGLAIDQGRGQQQFSFQIVDEGRSLADLAGDQSDEALGQTYSPSIRECSLHPLTKHFFMFAS